MTVPIIQLRGEILPPYESPEILPVFSEETELHFKTLDLAAARDPSCVSWGLHANEMPVGFVLGCEYKLFAGFHLQSQMWQR